MDTVEQFEIYIHHQEEEQSTRSSILQIQLTWSYINQSFLQQVFKQ